MLKENGVPTALQISALLQGPLTLSVSFICFLLTVEGQKDGKGNVVGQNAGRLRPDLLERSQPHSPTSLGKPGMGSWSFFQSLEEGVQLRLGGFGGHCLEEGILYSSEDSWEILSSIAQNFLSFLS